MDVEDKITLMRGSLGAVMGFVSFLTLSLSEVVSLAIPLVGYAVSVAVSKAIGGRSKWDLYLKGTYVYFLAWLLIVILAYNLSL